MRTIVVIAAVAALLYSTAAASAQHTISYDRGGRIGEYVDKYQHLRESHTDVRIEGLCASACTIVLAAYPRENICVTQKARLGFHAAWDYGPDDVPVSNPAATQLLMSMYPEYIKRWIRARGGLRPKMIWLEGTGLLAFFRACPPRARIEANAALRD